MEPTSAPIARNDGVSVFSSSAPISGASGVFLDDADSDGDDDDDELTADASLAKWWRSERRARGTEGGSLQTTHMNVAALERSVEGRRFLVAEASGLREELSRGEGEASTHASLASFLWRLKDYHGARQHYQRALARSGDAPGQRRHRGRWTKAIEMLNRQIASHEVQRAAACLLSSTKQPPAATCVERRPMDSLSYDEFIERYASQRVPVIITGGCVAGMVGGDLKPWGLAELATRLGDHVVPLKEPSKGSMQWASLENAGTMKAAEFVRMVQQGSTSRYLFDYSLPANRPDLAAELSVPKYFAQDMLQATPEGSLYRDGWPSLFVAPQGALSELHVDSFGSHFMMALLEGTKRWKFYSPNNIPYLYPSYARSPDPSFEVDLSQACDESHPLMRLASPMECILEAGEVLFVPAGCPHRVEGLTPSVALSMNYVDHTNLDLAQKELALAALTDPRAGRLLQVLRGCAGGAKPAGAAFIPYAEFKGGR